MKLLDSATGSGSQPTDSVGDADAVSTAVSTPEGSARGRDGSRRPDADRKRTRKRPTVRERYLPARFKPGFAWQLNRRSSLARELARELWDLWQDLGGLDSLSAQQRTLVERVVFLRRQILEHEQQALSGDPGKLTPNEYAAAVNTLIGLLKSLGIERQARPVRRLADIIGEARS